MMNFPPAVPAETYALEARVDAPAAMSRPGVLKSLLPKHGTSVQASSPRRPPSTALASDDEVTTPEGSEPSGIDDDPLLRCGTRPDRPSGQGIGSCENHGRVQRSIRRQGVRRVGPCLDDLR